MSLVQTLQTSRPASAAEAHRWGAFMAGVNVIGLLAVAAWLRITELDHVPGINGDEAWYGIQALRWWYAEPIAWRTPTNNVLNPFYFLPLTALHASGSPSAAMLRWPAVLSGLAALALNYWLCRRAFDRPTALVTTLVLAVLPINIAYSRFGWDTSQTLLATLPAVYLPLIWLKQTDRRARWLLAAALAFLASLIVHPTNIFTAPLLVVAALYDGRQELTSLVRRHRPAWQWVVAGTAACVTTIALGWLARHWLIGAAGRLLAPAEAWQFVLNYERLLSGLTPYQFIAGADLGWSALALEAGWWLLAAVAAGGLWHMWRQGQFTAADGCLVCGWAVMALGFFLVAGPKAIAPHWERYGLCLIAPAAALLGRGLARWCFHSSLRLTASATLMLAAWMMLLGFHEHYFQFIGRTGGRSHDTFRTATIEPKQQALAAVLKQRTPQQSAWIVTAEYWNEKPLLYLSAGHDRLYVKNWSAVRRTPALQEALEQHAVWFVEFTGSPNDAEVRTFLAQQGYEFDETLIDDYSGRPVLSILHPLLRPSQQAE